MIPSGGIQVIHKGNISIFPYLKIKASIFLRAFGFQLVKLLARWFINTSCNHHDEKIFPHFYKSAISVSKILSLIVTCKTKQNPK
jgi:hypothetical protein